MKKSLAFVYTLVVEPALLHCFKHRPLGNVPKCPFAHLCLYCCYRDCVSLINKAQIKQGMHVFSQVNCPSLACFIGSLAYK